MNIYIIKIIKILNMNIRIIKIIEILKYNFYLDINILKYHERLSNIKKKIKKIHIN
jgi:hypothetical protein